MKSRIRRRRCPSLICTPKRQLRLIRFAGSAGRIAAGGVRIIGPLAHTRSMLGPASTLGLGDGAAGIVGITGERLARPEIVPEFTCCCSASAPGSEQSMT